MFAFIGRIVMGRPIAILLIAVLSLASLIVYSIGSFASMNSGQPDRMEADFSNLQITYNLGSVPMTFTVNQGQWDEKVQFRANAGGATVWFGTTGVVYQFTRSVANAKLPSGPPDPGYDRFDLEPNSFETMMIRASFVGANPNPEMAGAEIVQHKSNYFIGNDPAMWYTDVPAYKSVTYKEIYPGIDLKYFGNGKQIEYDFIVEPGADPGVIVVEYEGAKSIDVNEAGELVVETAWGTVVEQTPFIYQPDGDERIQIKGEYALLTDNTFGFVLTEGYDPELALVIDPVVSYSTYLGSSVFDEFYDIVVDDSGNVFVTGYSYATGFPEVNPLQAGYGGGAADFVVCKIDAAGSMVYSTYLGGSLREGGVGVDVDDGGNAYVMGRTLSTDFPTVNAYQGTLSGDEDVCIAKINPAGNGLVYSTYLGGTGYDWSFGLCVADDETAYLAGGTYSTDFPVKNAHQPTNGGGQDCWVARLTSGGNGLVFSTYLGGTGPDYARDITVNSAGAAYVTGYTYSDDFILVNPIQAVRRGRYDAFVTIIGPNGGAPTYSTFLGGGRDDMGRGIVLDTDENIYVGGYTSSTDFPVANAYQSTVVATKEGFIAKLTPSGDAFVYSTYLGGNGEDRIYDIGIDAGRNVYVTGYTNSTGFYNTDAFQGTLGGSTDAFVCKLAASGDALVYSSYLGGSEAEHAWALAVSGYGAVYVVGKTLSSDFPTVNAVQTTNSGDADGFVTKISSNNTSPGVDVVVDVDENISLTFGEVTSPGITTVTVQAGGPPAPGGFNVVPIGRPVYYDIETTAGFTGDITVCFTYDEADVSGPESGLVLFHWEGDPLVSVDITSSVDTVANVICGVTSSLSPFALSVYGFCCIPPIRGDVNGDGADLDIVDLTCVVDYLFGEGCEMPCNEEADVNGDGASGDIVDLTFIVDWLFGVTPETVVCP